MAEVIGIVAASVQFAELLAKVAVRGAKLVSDLEHAPEEIKQKAQSLEDFHALYDSVRDVITQHTASLRGVSIKKEDFDHVHTLIVRADRESVSLEALIDRLKPPMSDIVAHLDTLRDVKTKIDSFFSISTFSHLVHHSAKVDATLGTLAMGHAQSVHTLSQIEKRQVADGQTLVSIGTTVTAMGDSHQAFSEENRQMHRNLQAGISSLHQQSIDHMNRGFDQLRDALADLKMSEESVRSPARQTTFDPQRGAESAPRCLVVSGPSTTGLSSICPCQRKGTKETILTMGPISLVRRQFGKHFPACPFSEHSGSSNITTSMLPELSDTFRQNLTVSTSWYAATATSFLRGVLHLPRVVDRLDPNAPGFKHFWKAIRLTNYDAENGRVRDLGLWSQVLTELYESLAYDFNINRGWANVQDIRGYTLFHSLIEAIGVLHIVDHNMSYILDNIIRLLVDGGTPLDAVGRADLGEDSEEPMMTAFDQHLETCAMFSTGSDFAQEQGYTTTIQVFRRNSLPTFALCSSSPVSFGFSSVLSFYLLPDLAIEHGCSRIIYSVITKDEGRLRHLLRTEHSSNGGPEDELLPPLCFAHSWPAGAQILLEANASPEAAVMIALHYQMPDFLETLLKHDMWLNEPRRAFRGHMTIEEMWDWFSCESAGTLVQAAISHKRSEKIIFSMIRATANARSELMRLATHHLSSSQLQDLGWTPDNYTGNLIESAAMATYEKLQSMGVELKKRHFPGRCTNVYDIPDENGQAPLLRHAPGVARSRGTIFSDMFDGLLWLLDHGASKSAYPELNHTTFLHKMTAALGSRLVEYLKDTVDIHSSDVSYHSDSATDADGTYDMCNADKIGAILRKLPKVLEHPTVVPLLLSRDHCDCSCSGGVGCSPITSFTKSARSWHKKGRCDLGTSCRAIQNIMMLWKYYGPRTGHAGCADFMDLCRVELFERLGMRHTCCHYGNWYLETPRGYKYVFKVGPYDVYGFHCLEAAEFREEDRFFRQKLEALMALYEELSARYDDGRDFHDEDWEEGSFKAFWDTWWKVLKECLPEEEEEDGEELSTDEMVEEIRHHIQRSMELDGF